jgi:hypothetical protein
MGPRSGGEATPCLSEVVKENACSWLGAFCGVA